MMHFPMDAVLSGIRLDKIHFYPVVSGRGIFLFRKIICNFSGAGVYFF